MSDRAYDYDALAWAKHQAALLRRVAAGERLNERVDWANVIEEVQDLGLSELRSCESLLRQALVHLLNLHAWPASRSAGYWRSEAIAFLADARKRFAPSMGQRLDLADLYETALDQVQAMTDESAPPRLLAGRCPYALGDLLAKRPDIAGLASRLVGEGAPMPDLAFDHDHDALAWSERQSALLRRLAAGERVNDAIDWANVIEEVQDVGLSELRSCASLLRQALVHLLKLNAWPGSRSTGHWRSETIGFLGGAKERYSPSMRQRIDLAAEYRLACRQVLPLDDDSGIAVPSPPACPFLLDDLLAEEPDVAALVSKLAKSVTAPGGSDRADA